MRLGGTWSCESSARNVPAVIAPFVWVVLGQQAPEQLVCLCPLLQGHKLVDLGMEAVDGLHAARTWRWLRSSMQGESNEEWA